MSSDCLFCNISHERIVLENDLAYAVRDGYPITEMHSMCGPCVTALMDSSANILKDPEAEFPELYIEHN